MLLTELKNNIVEGIFKKIILKNICVKKSVLDEKKVDNMIKLPI